MTIDDYPEDGYNCKTMEYEDWKSLYVDLVDGKNLFTNHWNATDRTFPQNMFGSLAQLIKIYDGDTGNQDAKAQFKEVKGEMEDKWKSAYDILAVKANKTRDSSGQ